MERERGCEGVSKVDAGALVGSEGWRVAGTVFACTLTLPRVSQKQQHVRQKHVGGLFPGIHDGGALPRAHRGVWIPMHM
jgi:hypothetical protein